MIDARRDPQLKRNAQSSGPRDGGKVGFVFSTKDRVDYTRHSLASLGTCDGFDLVWVDGSDSPEGRALPESVKTQYCRIVEVHHDVKGGPDAAIRFGLKRLLELGYEYCGLIENDIRFEPGWFPRLMELFQFGAEEHLNVGAATVFSLESRVMIHRPRYAFMWNMGACMVLFTREAARIVLATYRAVGSSDLVRFYSCTFGVDLRRVWELMMDQPDRRLGCDWAYAMCLYKCGLISLGTLPSMAIDMDHDFEKHFRTTYVQRNVEHLAGEEEIHRRLAGVMSDRWFNGRVIGQLRFLTDCARSRIYRAARRYRLIRIPYCVVSSLAKRCRSLIMG